MKKYEVTQTATAEVWAKNEMEAIEIATSEFFAFPEYNHEVKDVTPRHQLAEIERILNNTGACAYTDNYHNNIADFLRVTVTHAHPDDDENHFLIQMSLDDNERFDGNTYGLYSHATGAQIAEYDATLHPEVLAHLFQKKMRELTTTPEMKTTIEGIGEFLLKSGKTVNLESQEWRGMPAYLNIGEVVEFYEDGTPYNAPKYTLYYDLNGKGDGIAGTGYHLSLGDDESQIIAEIGNHDYPRVVGEILYNMGRADFDLESRKAGK
jgi:hypothetical protein